MMRLAEDDSHSVSGFGELFLAQRAEHLFLGITLVAGIFCCRTVLCCDTVPRAFCLQPFLPKDENHINHGLAGRKENRIHRPRNIRHLGLGRATLDVDFDLSRVGRPLSNLFVELLTVGIVLCQRAYIAKLFACRIIKQQQALSADMHNPVLQRNLLHS